MRLWLLVGAVMLGGACVTSAPCAIGAAGCECTQGGACDEGLSCSAGHVCLAGPRVDGGAVDDAGAPDSGAADAGVVDAGLGDAGPGDAGIGDAGLAPLLLGVVLMNGDDNSIAYMNGFGGDAGMPVALHLVNFGGVETASGGFTTLGARIDRVLAAHALPILHVATVPQQYSLQGTPYGIENHWDPTKVVAFTQTLGPILEARG